jgi:hypothetical protein
VRAYAAGVAWVLLGSALYAVGILRRLSELA